MPETALHYAEAAALANPMRAEAAALAGSACVQRGETQRAAVWLARAVRIARRTQDWVWYARSQIRFGRLLYEQGDLGRARRCYERAHRKAVWSGHYECAAKAHHDMLLIECSGGTYRSAEAHALSALELYPMRSHRLPHLAQDFAYLLTCHGAYTDALEVLDAALPLLTRPDERIAAYATTAKASAGATQSDRHLAASEDVLLLASLSDVNAAGALMLAAEGAHILSDWERADFLATASIHIAKRRQEREPLERARKVLDAATRRIPPDPVFRAAPPERVNGAKAAFLMRLKKLRVPTEDAETRASPNGRDCTGMSALS
jgi:tetratricopeptide (TPR) repeat protein